MSSQRWYIISILILAMLIGVGLAVFSGKTPAPPPVTFEPVVEKPVEKPIEIPRLDIGVGVAVIATGERGTIVGATNSYTWDVRVRVTIDTYMHTSYVVAPFLPSELQALPLSK